MLGSFLTRFRAAFLWVKLRDLSSRGRHAEALERVRSADEKLRRFFFLRLFEIQQLSFLKNDIGVLTHATVLIKDLAGKTSANERYALAYARWISQAVFKRLHASSDLPSDLALSADAIPDAGVDTEWKTHFHIPLGANGRPIELPPNIGGVPRGAIARPDDY